MKNKHTPGEWRLAEFNSATVLADHSEKGKNIIVAQCDLSELHGKSINKDMRKVSEANARLIAASPELLEALEAVIRLEALVTYPKEVDQIHIDEAIAINDMLIKVKAAINKAKGE